jgi:hypothetical protein
MSRSHCCAAYEEDIELNCSLFVLIFVIYDGDGLHGSPSSARHPLFPRINVDDFDFSHRNMESQRPPMRVSPARSPFRNDVPPSNPYWSSRPAGLHVNGNGARGESDDEEEASLGGRIVTPRHADRRRQALASKISPMDIVRFGNMRYHGGPCGYTQLMMNIVHNCGFTELNTNDIIISYNKIIHLHTEVLAHWDHPRGYYLGPQVDRILEKGISSFPRLTVLTVDATVEFYDNLHKTSLIFLLPVMPFNCISIKIGFEALCPPGLGLPHYAIIARVLMEVLPKLLPRTDTQVTSLIMMPRMESGNGYDLLWQIMALTVPGFDPTIQVMILAWQDDDIIVFSTSFALYFRLQVKKGVVSDDRTRSTTLLNAVLEPAYTDAITTLLTCINNYYSMDDKSYLPPPLVCDGPCRTTP